MSQTQPGRERGPERLPFTLPSTLNKSPLLHKHKSSGLHAEVSFFCDILSLYKVRSVHAAMAEQNLFILFKCYDTETCMLENSSSLMDAM